ncbi:MAG: 50S ribosomal protein L23 [Bacilli bacterium]|nr:50S ribosomal protein L23 [Bacilli bacterium]
MDRFRDIIKAPIITEKSQELQAKENTFVFSVDVNAGKTEIKEAIEKLFNVEVLKVNTLNTYPKKKRVGRYAGRANKVKKAIVKLKEGNSIEF